MHAASPSSMSERRQRWLNLLASTALVAAVLLLHRLAPWLQPPLARGLELGGRAVTVLQLLQLLALPYVLGLALYYFLQPRPLTSKSVVFLLAGWRALRDPRRAWRQGLEPGERVGVLAVAVKLFYAPLMSAYAIHHGADLIGNLRQLGAAAGQPGAGLLALWDGGGFWLLLNLILLVDVLCFCAGYLVESPALGSEIRSVDTAVLGWGSALLCYPPFVLISQAALGWPSADFPRFAHPAAHLGLNALVLALMAGYAWASVALGFKASNLTHRGIVARGPYAVVRHPAYACKCLAWWIGTAALILAAVPQAWWKVPLLISSMTCWTLLYGLRALTEEQHLRRVDGAYDAYCARVRYRFIPGVL